MFTALGTWFANFLTGYVAGVVGALATALTPVALLWLTVYVANYGYAVTRGEAPEPLATFGWKMVKIGFILAIALTAGQYMALVFNTADGMQDGMATIFLRGGEFSDSAPATVFGSLDGANDRANDILKQIWRGAGMTRLDLVVASVFFSLGTVIFLVLGAFVTLLAKVVLAFGLAIGPIAILCLMFKPTARFFDAWLSLILSAVVLAWFVFFALGLSLYVVDVLIEGADSSGAFRDGGAANAIEAASTYLTVMVLLAIVLYQAPTLAASLTGGSTIQMGYQMVANTALAMRAVMGNRMPAPGAGGGGSGGSLTRGAGMPHRTGRAIGNAASGAKAAYQRVVERGNR